MITFFQATCDVSDIDALFNLADSDGNGELSQEEFSAFIASLSGVYPGGGMTFSSDELISVYGAMNPSASGKVMCAEFRGFVLSSAEHHAFHDELTRAAKENRRGYGDAVVSSHTVVDSEAPGDPPAGWSAPGVAESKAGDATASGDGSSGSGGGACVLS